MSLSDGFEVADFVIMVYIILINREFSNILAEFTEIRKPPSADVFFCGYLTCVRYDKSYWTFD
ncbi:MAG: hypothetical protein PHF37_09550 [Phycisphaerae bacterium]|nr:hypothetical protein [Phycisphaerae bacterium]